MGRDFPPSRPARVPPSLLYNRYRVFTGSRKRPGLEADFSPPSSAEVYKQSRAVPLHSLRAFVAYKKGETYLLILLYTVRYSVYRTVRYSIYRTVRYSIYRTVRYSIYRTVRYSIYRTVRYSIYRRSGTVYIARTVQYISYSKVQYIT